LQKTCQERDVFPCAGKADAAGETISSERWGRRDKITPLLPSLLPYLRFFSLARMMYRSGLRELKAADRLKMPYACKLDTRQPKEVLYEN
jgi:hypothetical protein